MTTHIHIGQCGNQLGLSFWELAHSTYQPLVSRSPPNGPLPTDNESCSELFHARGNARAIWLDSEPKVVQEALERGYAVPEQVNFEQSGRGNNFSMGFLKSKNLCERTLEQLRKEIEMVDIYRGTVLWHSTGGGVQGLALVQNYRRCCEIRTHAHIFLPWALLQGKTVKVHFTTTIARFPYHACTRMPTELCSSETKLS